jgi:PAS domain S-box-containing protein
LEGNVPIAAAGLPLDAVGGDAFRQAFDHLPIPMWLFDRGSMRFVDVNAAALAAYGWSRDAFLQMQVTDLTPDAGAVAGDVADVVEATAPGAGRCRHRTASEALRDVRWIACAIGAGGRDLVFVTAQDDTDAVRAEADARRLAVSEARFRGLAEAMPLLVYTKRADGTGFANQYHLDFVGTTQAALVSGSWLDNLHPDDVVRVRAERAAAIRDFVAMATEFRVRAADGSYRWVISRSAPIREADGSVTWIGAAMDIDDRRRQEQELRLLALAMACVRDYIVIFRIDPVTPAKSAIVFANQALIDKTGYPRDAVIGVPFSRLLGKNPEGPATVAKLRASMLARERVRVEFKQFARDATPYWVDADVIPMTDADGSVTHVVAIARDITARKAAEEEVFYPVEPPD